MDSLLASYASSDEEEDNHSSLSLPPPKPIPSPSSSLLCSLPPPNPSILHQHHHGDDDEEPESNPPQFPRPNSPAHEPPPNPTFAPTKPPSFFSSLPPPRSNPDPHPNPNPTPTISSSVPPPKRVVQFQLPINPNLAAHKDDDESHDEDDDADEEPKRPTKMGSQSSLGPSSVMSFLSSIPAPKNTKMALGALPSSGSGSGRRSVLEASGFNEVRSEDEASRAGVDAEFGDHEINWTDATPPVVSGSDGGIVGAASIEVNHSSWVPGNQNYDHYDSYGSYGGSESNWANGSSTMAMTPESYAVGMIENVVKVPGKRGRNEIPTTIVEVKQDELIKNRPREDQSKLTGVAFGPSYQPVSAKGKPSKLHKRKHQIGSLFFDMKQKETELAERRSRGFLTKAETQAKYGW